MKFFLLAFVPLALAAGQYPAPVQQGQVYQRGTNAVPKSTFVNDKTMSFMSDLNNYLINDSEDVPLWYFDDSSHVYLGNKHSTGLTEIGFVAKKVQNAAHWNNLDYSVTHVDEATGVVIVDVMVTATLVRNSMKLNNFKSTLMIQWNTFTGKIAHAGAMNTDSTPMAHEYFTTKSEKVVFRMFNDLVINGLDQTTQAYFTNDVVFEVVNMFAADETPFPTKTVGKNGLVQSLGGLLNMVDMKNMELDVSKHMKVLYADQNDLSIVSMKSLKLKTTGWSLRNFFCYTTYKVNNEGLISEWKIHVGPQPLLPFQYTTPKTTSPFYSLLNPQSETDQIFKKLLMKYLPR